MVVDPLQFSVTERQTLLNNMVAPRPIALVSTINQKGKSCLSAFSYFSVCSVHPPVVVFSATNRVKNGAVTNSVENVMEIPEAVIHILEQEQLDQVNLITADFENSIDKFRKAGFTKEPATIVSPPMVKECRMKMECKVTDIRALGHEGGAGNLIICEILRIHIADSIVTTETKIDTGQVHFAGRIGGNLYCRVGQQDIFPLIKPKGTPIGLDNLPPSVLDSAVFTTKHLVMLASVEKIPGLEDVLADTLHRLLYPLPEAAIATEALHRKVARLLDAVDIEDAWKLLLSP